MDAYTGEIKIWPSARLPQSWHFCDGTLLNISEYQALYSLIGTLYGGDGATKFALPDMRTRLPIHKGQGTGLTNRPLASTGGTNTVTLTEAQMPAHTHSMVAATVAATTNTPGSTTLLGAAPAGMSYFQTVGHGEATVALNTLTVGTVGASQPHNNQMPTIGVNYIICLNGMYPTQN